MISLLVLAPGQALRAGLRAILESEGAVQVVAEAASLAALEGPLPPVDVIVAAAGAFTRPDLDDLLNDAEPAPALLLLADSGEDAAGLSGLPLRAWGLLPVEASEEELLAAVAALHEGLVAASPEMLLPLLGPGPSSVRMTDDLVDDLTDRELEVLARLADGLANKQIAAALGISDHTVKFHVSSIYTKLGVTNRAEAVRMAARLGLISL
ncbi:MAG: response regulator transcription factor [Anaerolineae bacterium]|nr:MAG: response regulator transcription factor [Anaerolineae bacterium]